MTATDHQDKELKKLCTEVIDQRLGDISGLPQELIEFIFSVYNEFIASYLNMLRQQRNKPANWMPASLSIDNELVDGMRHFFSDYQHITREFDRLNQKMDRLQEIDIKKQFNLYQHTIDDILKVH